MHLTEVDGVPIQPLHRARCHCGAVVFELSLPNGLVDIRRCDCSFCRRRGAVMAFVPMTALRIIQGEKHLKLYQFHTKTAKHFFCMHCGIYTHHQRRSDPTQYGFNVACLDDINPLKIQGIPTVNGINHPADRR